MTRRIDAIRAAVSMNIAISESLLVFSKNYLEALRYVLYWFKKETIQIKEMLLVLFIKHYIITILGNLPLFRLFIPSFVYWYCISITIFSYFRRKIKTLELKFKWEGFSEPLDRLSNARCNSESTEGAIAF